MTAGPPYTSETQVDLNEVGFWTYAKERQAKIEAFLEEYLPSVHRRPKLLHEAMRYVVQGGGKRMRPILCVAAAEVCGGHIDRVAPTACALELIHAFSLVHDDLPALDNDPVRRGQPSCHVKYGDALAILTGDALFARAFELIALQRELSPPAAVLQVLDVISGATSSDGMVGGEVEDLLAEGTPGDITTLEFIHTHKSGALIRAAVTSGAILAGADAAACDALANYGEALGHAFQIMDDVLGEEGEPSTMGKPVHSDRDRGKLTYPRLLGIRQSMVLAREMIDGALFALSPFDQKADPLRWMALYVVNRDR